ncbi:Tuberculostearic acid methyltransferase UfaA1 [Pontiella desulfatans]|uniref:Tuberculostearic acid methyltransferase UfaA1 n=1 Tax=Pontiella desulfatans TaxID=2750659 RepID=A0A6C2TVF6_PONDE|nr:cyclopropane-fatty-acyl-phospholipid synthase family protein [Pontiella desulfatans]VGO11599.1 Tuberculostearic acid methyltransferase UfaA1 [Pontiella desulfatans]
MQTLFEERCERLVDQRLKNIKTGHLIIELPNGIQVHYGDDSPPRHIKVNRYSFFSRLVTAGNIGMGEAWMANDWESEDLTGVLELFIGNMGELSGNGVTARVAKRFHHMVQHSLNRSTITSNRCNIHAHYDLGNEFYQLFLDDETMMFSSAIFLNQEEPLPDAQRRKIRCLIERADIQPEHHLLDIGCGWGGFAIAAARLTGCRVTGITLSEEHSNFAQQRIAAEGLEDQVEILVCDYREMEGKFDRIVSIELLEVLGHAHLGTFFARCDRLLKPSGRAVLQVSCIPDEYHDLYHRSPDWVQKYIYHGGMLPSQSELTGAMERHSTLAVESQENIGLHYAETLRRWRRAFEANRRKLMKLGYDGEFQRKWIYYLCYCEAGFQTRFTNTLHLVLARPGENIG